MSDTLTQLCEIIQRLTYGEMLEFSQKLANAAVGSRDFVGVADALSQIAIDGFATKEVAKHEQAQLLKMFKRKRQIVVTALPGGAYEVKVPSMGNVAVVHRDLKQALSQSVDTLVALYAMQK